LTKQYNNIVWSSMDNGLKKLSVKICGMVEWIKTNADRITVGVLSFIAGSIATMVYLFIVGYMAWYKGK
jgi:hypothetical protein